MYNDLFIQSKNNINISGGNEAVKYFVSLSYLYQNGILKQFDALPYDNDHSATATIKLSVDGRVRIAASDGDGPVNALDRALREALEVFYPCLRKLRLIDYKVRVMEPKDATAASVRVLITSSDGEDIWTTVGVSQDVINASWIALVDSIEHKLVSMGENLHR